MKRLLFPLIGVIFLVGCGVQNREVPTPPEVQALLKSGWNLYDQGDYESALDTFNSVINLDVFNAEAYLGAGLSYAYLGDLANAKSFFIFAVSVSGKSPIRVGIEQFTVDYGDPRIVVDEAAGTWTVVAQYRPVLGYNEIKLNVDAIKVREFTDSSFTFLSSDYPPPASWSDSLASPDTIKMYYVYFDSTVSTSDVMLWAFVGNAAAHLAEDEDMMGSIIYANAALSGGVPQFDHNPNFKKFDVGLTLALAAFKAGYYGNCVRAIKTYVDPNWDFDGDPYNPDNYDIILAKLNNPGGS